MSLDYSALPPLLTDLEAAELLRLTDDADTSDAALKRLARLVDSKQLRPAIIGKRRRFAVVELRRFIEARTAAYGEVVE